MKLETERLILRKPSLRDVKDHFEGINNFEVTKHLSSVPYPYTEEMSRQYIRKLQREWRQNPLKKYSFFIELKEEGKMIGALGTSEKNFGIWETGSWLNRKYHQKGYMTEAKIVLNEFVFNELGARKMETSAYAENIASNKTQLGVGYKYEGCKRKEILSKATGKYHDSNLYGLLREEWKAFLPKLQKKLEEKVKRL
ncbi:GNAT family N-acetyltransferase [archaeon]|jgi:[ribosomal protein S5]-alanine N-acetyltransferase|nr:GNAT family N-acetyltransferase [archaeon]